MGKHRSRSYSSDTSEDEYLKRRIKRLRRRLKERSRHRDRESRPTSVDMGHNRRRRRDSDSKESYYSSRSKSGRSRSRSREPGSSSSNDEQMSPRLPVPVDEHTVDCSTVKELVDPLLPDLDTRVLNAMGADSTKKVSVGEAIHELLASQYEELIKKGVSEDVLLELGKKYPCPENCTLLQAPKLNPELKAAINDSGKKRDDRLWNIQNLVGTALAAVGKAETILLKKQDKDDETLTVIGCLSDVGRLLAKVHHSESEARRSIILGFSLQSNLQPILKEALLEAPLDGWLFGTDLSDRLKAAKVLEKSVADLRAVKSRPVLQVKDLNSQGPFRQQKRVPRYQQPHQRQSGQNRYRSRPQKAQEERGKKTFRRKNSRY